MPEPRTPNTTPPGHQQPRNEQVGLDLNRPLPAVLELTQAAALLGVGRTTAYRLVHDQQWPTPVLRLGKLIKIPSQPLLELLAGRTSRNEDQDSRAATVTELGSRRDPGHAVRTTD